MNKNYETVSIDLARIEKLTEQVDSICALDIPADIPNGDMPGDKIEIGESHIIVQLYVYVVVQALEKAKLLLSSHICLHRLVLKATQ